MDNNKLKNKTNMLSPISLDLKSKDEDGRWEYLNRLNNAINDEDGYNIAISGTYGTGKSSIVKTYIDKYKMNDKVLKVNIGSFLKTNPDTLKEKDEVDKDINKGNSSDIDSEDDGVLSEKEELLMQKVEKTIVKQLIYTTKYSKSKLSSIPRLQNNWQKKYLLYSIAIAYVIICLYYFIIDQVFITKLVNESFNLLNNIPLLSKLSIKPLLPYLKVLLLVDILVIIVKFIYYLFTIFNKLKTKINIKNYELEIDNSSTSKFSFMDNIYEILYSFMNSSVEVVFFEDIDRYQRDICIKIVEDLKELNSIINGCNGMNHKKYGRKKVVFVYSFKDSIFYKYTEKNKFYDYIISIMPISTRYNSQMLLINELNNAGINFNSIDGELLNMTSLHITDMRTIKNIVNDLSLFIKVLKLDNDKMDINQVFALCVYKNYDLVGYDNMLEYDNPIDKILTNLGSIIEEEVKKDKMKLKINIENIKKNKVETKETIFTFNKINGELPQYIVIGDKEITYDEFMSDKFDIKSMNNNEIYVKLNNQIYAFNYDTKIDDFIDSIKGYDDKIYEYNYQLNILNNVFDDNNNDENLFKYSKKYLNDVLIGKKDLNSRISNKLYHTLTFKLVYSGYIRYDYMDFITTPVDSEHFSLYDSRFIFGYNHQKYDFNARIDHPDRILNYLGKDSYNSPYILNNSILKYIYNDLDNSNKKNILNQFNDITNEKLDFLYQLYEKDIIFFKNIIHDLSNNFKWIWEDYSKKIDNKKIDDSYNHNSIIVELSLACNHDISKYQNIEKLRTIIQYYTNQDNIMLVLENDDNKVINEYTINNLKRLDIHFNDINSFINDNNDFLLDTIVKEDLYELNKNNVLAIINHEKNTSEQNKLNYEMMKNSKYSEYFKNTIINHIDSFSLNIYLLNDLDKFIINDDELIKEILIKTDDDSLIKEILKRENFIIDGYNIPIKYLNLAYQYKHISINWKTISLYSNGSYSIDNDLFNLAYDNIELFYNSNISSIDLIPQKFMKRLLDALYKDKKYHITDVILNNYNNIKLERYNIYTSTAIEEVNQKVKHNLVLFSKPNFNKIANISNRETLYCYTKNLLKNHDIDKIIDLINEQMLIDLKHYFSETEKIVILNKLIKKENISNDKIITLLFKTNILYSVPYRKEYMENIFNKMKEVFSICVHENGMIKFKL